MPRGGRWRRLTAPIRGFFDIFNRGFDWLSRSYGALTARLVRLVAFLLIVYGGLIFLAYGTLVRTPTGLIPQLDRGYFIAAFQLPPGSTLDRTDAVIRRASEIMLTRPGVRDAVAFVGFDGATFTNAPNTGVIFVALKSFAERQEQGLAKDAILQDLRQQMFALREAFAFVLEPPSVPGIGTGGGLKGYVQDRAGRGLARWKARPGRWPARPRRPRASSSPSRSSIRARRRSMPTSTAPRPSSSACRSAACSRLCRSTWARPSSTTSTSWAAPTA